MRNIHLGSSLLLRSLAGLALLLCASGAASAQDTFNYDLEGKFGWFGEKFDSTLTFTKRPDGRYTAVRSWAYRAEGSAPRQDGVADVQVRRQRVNGKTRTVVEINATFTPMAGATDVLSNLGQGGEEQTGRYRVEGDRISGWVQVKGRDGSQKRVYEKGRKTDSPVDYGNYDPATGVTTNPDGTTTGGSGADSGSGADAGEGSDGVAGVSSDQPVVTGDSLPGTLDPNLIVLQPAQGVYLAGQQVRLEAQGAEATKIQVVSGPAEIKGRVLTLTGPGAVRVQLKSGDSVSQPVDLEAVQAQIVGVTVLNAIAIADAPAPHFTRAFGAQPAEYAWEPAAILQDTQLRVRVKLQAPKDLTVAAKVRLSASEADLDLGDEVTLQGLAAGQEVELVSAGVLAAGVQVNALDLDWSLGAQRDAIRLGTFPLRVYTVYGQPVDNPLPQYGPTQRQGHALNTKLHYELVCTWAKGARFNRGNGDDSIGYQVDNQMRHHVAWQDYGNNVPLIPHYPEGAEPPLNYSLIRGSISNGQRGISSIFYPPQKVTRPVEEYENYRNNFGWWVLDNPVYAGGRCNQQASLICDLVGTIGLEAEVYYIERVGRGTQTGRPVRRYYRSSRSTTSWNFHGQAKVKMEDGSFWLYDGSGSSPPRRINGKVEELMAVPGPYIAYWEAWKYEDGGGYAPLSDWPTTWRGVPLMEGEAPLDPNAADGTYSYQVGRGRMDDTGQSEFHGRTLTFFAVNVGGRFFYKVGEGKADAPNFDESVHGKIADWLGN